MTAWSVEVRHGQSESIPSSLAALVAAQGALGPTWVFVAEAGVLLNEPEDRFVRAVPEGAPTAVAIARLGQACAWVLDRLEVELGQRFKWNYVKLSFVNMSGTETEEASSTGRMTTNAPELPELSEQPPSLLIVQLVKAASLFFAHLHASAEPAGWETEIFGCRWASIALSRAD